ncbi:unnamed protein product [Phaedon cochleariae]|uniref:sn-1-specific diacylglycerol lipase ABHD11 n=1 Tax=Phaedon cochleariae TaxID=80249 RepID=A0A9N9SDI3_PHACE|nr:unnamed protein product [Phaedon cochleariae]
MFSRHHVKSLSRIMNQPVIIQSLKHKSSNRPHFSTDEDPLELAYASYEPTESYSKTNPEPTPLIVLHGYMASKNHWNSFCKKCHENTKSKVVAIDARNHGDSPHHSENSYDSLVVDVRRFMERMGLKKANFLGHSMGGRTAMLFALKYPELVEKLIVADISPISTSPELKQLPKLLYFIRKIEIPEKTSLAEARKLISQKIFTVLPNKQLVQFMLSNLVQKTQGRDFFKLMDFKLKKSAVPSIYEIETFKKRVPSSSYWELLNDTFAEKENENEIKRREIESLKSKLESKLEDLGKLQCAISSVHGVINSDPVQNVQVNVDCRKRKSDYPKIIRLFPNAELKYIEGAGHWLHSEKPAEFLKITLDFLNKTVPSSN